MVKKEGALIVVDVQNDFCPEGALPVPRGDEVVPIINELVDLFNVVIFTQDWHPENHCSFIENGGSWPQHCVQRTRGAELRGNLNFPTDFTVVYKGTDPAKEAYSPFDGTPLQDVLWRLNEKKLYICGLATDYCVKATALDARKAGFETFVIIDACRGVNVKEGDTERAIEEMQGAGIKIITSKDI